MLSTWLLLIVALLFSTLFIFSRAGARFAGPIAQLFRVFLPSWRFFDESSPTPTLFYRWTTGNGELGCWVCLRPPKPRQLSSLLLNPDGNLRLAQQSLLEQLVNEASEHVDAFTEESGINLPIDDAVSFRLVRNLVEFEVMQHLNEAKSNSAGSTQLPELPYRYQFKLSLAPTAADPAQATYEDVLISPLYEHEGRCP